METWQEELIIPALLLLISAILYKYLNAPKNQPPGPWGLPLVGYKLFLGQKPHETIANMKPKFGDIVKINMGSEDAIFLSSFKAMKEAFINQADIFSDRAQHHVIKEHVHNPGIIRSSGDIWSDLRRFSLSSLRNFGFGKSTLEPQIKEEIHHFLEELKSFNGAPIPDVGEYLRKSVTNVICIIMTGRRFDYKDKLFNQLIHLSHEHVSRAGVDRLVNLIPQPLRFQGLFKALRLKTPFETVFELCEVISKVVDNFEREYELGSQNNFIDVWLMQSKNENVKNRYIKKQQLAPVLADLFVAGSDTTTNTLGWCLLYMMEHPEIQNKVQQEIDDVIGRERTPTMADQKLMPYTEATIMEVSRIVTIVPLSIVHCTRDDATLLGYSIPKNTLVIPNLWAVHHDPEVFPEPEKFKPERFLTADKQLKRMEEYLPFSLGKRQCMGESLAKMELFLYFTSMLQQFTFKKYNDSVDLDYNYAVITIPKPQPMQVLIRGNVA